MRVEVVDGFVMSSFTLTPSPAPVTRERGVLFSPCRHPSRASGRLLRALRALAMTGVYAPCPQGANGAYQQHYHCWQPVFRQCSLTSSRAPSSAGEGRCCIPLPQYLAHYPAAPSLSP